MLKTLFHFGYVTVANFLNGLMNRLMVLPERKQLMAFVLCAVSQVIMLVLAPINN